MKRWGMCIIALLTALTVFGPISSVSAAQQQQVIQNPGSHTLTWNASWTLDPNLSTGGAGYSISLLTNPNGIFFATAVYDPSLTTAPDLIDSFVDGFDDTLSNYTIVDAGAYQNVTYELGTGDGLTLFALFLDGGLGAQSVGYFVVAPSGTFASAVSTIQADVRLDGGLLLTGVDGNGLQSQALGQAPTVQIPTGPTTFAPLNPSAAVQTVTAGTSTVAMYGPWSYDAEASIPEQASFSQIDILNQSIKLVSYGEFYDSSVTMVSQAMDVFSQAFFEGAGVVAGAPVGQGALSDGAIWRMYSFNLDGTAISYFITVTQRADGAYVITTLTANTADMATTIFQAQNQFLLNGVDRLFEAVVIGEVTTGLPGTIGGPSGGSTAGGPIRTVGGVAVQVNAPWALLPENSATYASFELFDSTGQAVRIGTYARFTDTSVTTRGDTMDVYTDAYFESAGITVGEMNGTGTLADGSLWRMYTFPMGTQQVLMSYLVTVNQAADGTWVVSSLKANTGLMQESIVLAQQSIALDGVSAVFDGIDAASVTANLPVTFTGGLAA